jgi:hypothetical protein
MLISLAVTDRENSMLNLLIDMPGGGGLTPARRKTPHVSLLI